MPVAVHVTSRRARLLKVREEKKRDAAREYIAAVYETKKRWEERRQPYRTITLTPSSSTPSASSLQVWCEIMRRVGALLRPYTGRVCRIMDRQTWSGRRSDILGCMFSSELLSIAGVRAARDHPNMSPCLGYDPCAHCVCTSRYVLLPNDTRIVLIPTELLRYSLRFVRGG